jgi:DNA polymerase-3 subunit delta
MITTLTGVNSFSLRRALDALVLAFVTEQGEGAADMALERLDGQEASFDRLSEALTSLPFLASKKLVVLYTPGANKQFTERVEQLLAGVPETTDVVVVEPRLDKRSVYFKLLKKTTDYQEFPELDINGLARWAVEYTKVGGGSLSSTDARFLVERAGVNQELVANEVAKLGAYNPAISRQTIELLSEPTPQSTVFELLEAAFSGNAHRTMALYDEQRAMKVEPQQIIAMLAWQLHIVALLKTAGSRTPDQVAKEAKISPFVAKKSAAIARRIAPSRFKQLLQGLLTIDMRLKRESLDADEALRNYLLQMAH